MASFTYYSVLFVLESVHVSTLKLMFFISISIEIIYFHFRISKFSNQFVKEEINIQSHDSKQ